MNINEKQGQTVYFPYSVPPGVPFFVEGGKAEEYPTYEDVRRREHELAVEARKRFSVFRKDVSVVMFLFGELIYSILVPSYEVVKRKMMSAYYSVHYYYAKLAQLGRLFLHGIRISHLKYLIAKEKDEARWEYLDMKLWHVDKKFWILTDFNFYHAGEENSKENWFYEPVQKYKELEAEIKDVESWLGAWGVKEDERRELFLDAKEKHRLAYRQLIIIEGILIGVRHDFCDSLTKLAGELKNIAEALGVEADEINREVESKAPFLREKYREGAVRVYKLLLVYDRQSLLWIWFRSGHDFFRYWRIIRFLEKENIIVVEHNQPVRFKDDLQSLLHAMAEGWREGMEKQKTNPKWKESDSILHKPLSREELFLIAGAAIVLVLYISMTAFFLLQGTSDKDLPNTFLVAGLSVLMLVFYGCVAVFIKRIAASFCSWVVKAVKKNVQV